MTLIHVEDDDEDDPSQLNDSKNEEKHVVSEFERHLIEAVAGGDGKVAVSFRVKEVKVGVDVFCRRYHH